jgi:hypothetical protein
MIKRWAWFGAVVLGAVAASACSQGPEASDENVSTSTQPILNGAPANEAKLGAVVALVYTIPDTDFVLDAFCSGTLVGPRAVVTARHCTPMIDQAAAEGLTAAVAFGPDAFAPIQVVPITNYVAAPHAPGNEKGLLLDGGRDVAVAHLASVPAGVTPAKLGEFSESMIGTKFQIAGFGMYNFDAFYGQKYAGVATARATNGDWYPLLFNRNFQAFHEWYFTDSALAAPSEQEAREWWKRYRLENKYELLAGGLPGEAVACYGDSGGPLLLGSNANNLTTYGVSFAVEATYSTVCGLGGGYLVFNRKMLDFVRQSL